MHTPPQDHGWRTGQWETRWENGLMPVDELEQLVADFTYEPELALLERFPDHGHRADIVASRLW